MCELNEWFWNDHDVTVTRVLLDSSAELVRLNHFSPSSFDINVLNRSARCQSNFNRVRAASIQKWCRHWHEVCKSYNVGTAVIDEMDFGFVWGSASTYGAIIIVVGELCQDEFANATKKWCDQNLMISFNRFDLTLEYIRLSMDWQRRNRRFFWPFSHKRSSSLCWIRICAACPDPICFRRNTRPSRSDPQPSPFDAA